MKTLSIGCDNLVRVDNLTNEVTGSYVNTATLAMTVRDSSLAAVTGGTSIAMAYVAGSNGRYHGTVPNTLILTAGAIYYVDVVGSGESLDITLRVPCRAAYAKG